MKKHTKIFAALLALTFIVLSVSCNKNTQNVGTDSKSDSYKFGIVLLVENGAFLDMKQGIIDELAAKGYKEGENTTIDYFCAQGDTTNLSTICSSLDDGTYNAVFTVATPTTQQFVNLESSTPCFFCSVSAPVAAGVISDMAKPDKNATGTSNAIPVSDIFALSDKLTPNCETYGLIYCTSEANSVNTIEACKKYLDENNMKYVEASVSNSSEVQTAVESLVGKVDAMFVPNDSVVQSAVTTVADVAKENKIPVYCASATTVASGCFATIAIDDKGIGAKTADMAVEYLGGKKLSDIPSIVVPADYVSINKTTLEAIGASVPEDMTDVVYLG